MKAHFGSVASPSWWWRYRWLQCCNVQVTSHAQTRSFWSESEWHRQTHTSCTYVRARSWWRSTHEQNLPSKSA